MQPKQSLYVVSGLPRSGTSMMMRMLAAGGLELMTDDRRQADEDNPNGYFEFEPVKHMADSVDFLDDLDDKVVKIVSPLLPYLPLDRHYRIIFMLRSLEEILLSQKKMLARNGQPFSEEVQSRLRQKFSDHLYDIRLWIARRLHFHCLFVPYAEVISAPLTFAQRLADFLAKPCDVEAMAAAVDPALYRNQVRDAKTT